MTLLTTPHPASYRRAKRAGKGHILDEFVATTLTDRILRQSKTLVCAIEALGTIEPRGPIERAAVRLLLYAYKRRLRAVVAAAPAWVSEEILSASEHIGDDRAVLWMSQN